VKTWLKIAAGLLSVTPLVSSVVMGAVVAFAAIAQSAGSGSPLPTQNPFDETDLLVFLFALGAVVLLQLATAVGFSLHAAHNRRLDNWGKTAWIIGFFLIGMMALPAYFLLHMLREPPPSREAALDRSPLAAPRG
jgi:hypothetical protein